jgi:hypothetical protein
MSVILSSADWYLFAFLLLPLSMFSCAFENCPGCLAEAKERSGSGDSSGEEDSDDEDEGNRSQQDSSAHDEVSCLLQLNAI